MATTERMIIGAFEGPQRTEQVIHELLHAGFRNDHIRFSGHQAATGSVLASLTNLFVWRGTAVETPIDDVVGLVAMGVPEEDARMHAMATRNASSRTPLYSMVMRSGPFEVAIMSVSAQSSRCERSSKNMVRSSAQEAKRYSRSAVEVAGSVGSSTIRARAG